MKLLHYSSLRWLVLCVSGIICTTFVFFMSVRTASAVLLAPSASPAVEQETCKASVTIKNAQNEANLDAESLTDCLFPEVKKQEMVSTDTSALYTGIYASVGSAVQLDKTATSDVFVAGGDVMINKPVGGDVFAAAKNITIAERVGGSIRLSGSEIVISNSVNGNALIIGRTVRITALGNIAGHANIYAETIIVDGVIQNVATLKAENIIINGTLKQQSTLKAESVAFHSRARLHLNDSHRIAVAAAHMTFDPQANGKEFILYQQQKQQFRPFFKNTHSEIAPMHRFNRFILSFFFFALIGVILILLWPQWTKNVVRTMNTQVRESWQKGALFFFIVPAISIALIFTFIGIPLSVLMMILYMPLLLLGRLWVGAFIGEHVMNEHTIKNKQNRAVLQFLVGYFILSLVMSLPWIGWIFSILAAMWGVGGMLHARTLAKKSK